MNYSKCWLSYNPVTQYRDSELLTKITVCRESSQAGAVIKNAAGELLTAFSSILNIHPDVCYSADNVDNVKSGIVLGLTDEAIISEEGYRMKQDNGRMLLTGRTEKGLLYAVFDLIRRIAADSPLRGLDLVENPVNHLRMLNHWDNMDGSIERGYSGKSLFFDHDEILVNERTLDYARLAASVGINGTVINNVNVGDVAASGLITDRYLDKLRKLTDILSGYGIKLFLSLNFASPIEVGGLNTADPLDENVAAWWNRCVKHIYEKIPDFGGFLVKADSEGRPGPFTYHRTHADGSNMLARALKPYGGLVIWRCFVYNCRQDWRDYKTDRARAAYDNFIGLDGEFDDNVILQIKNGPMDFQVREPVSPLFGGLRKTNMLLEVQAAQEYTGQQKHVCCLIPMWKEVLDFNTYSRKNASTVAEIISGKAFGQANCGMAAVSNTGNDYNWTGHDLAAANLYGFGRLSWNTGLSSDEIAKEWIRLTFPHDDKVLRIISDILLGSWHTYEKYTAPLGIGWMVNPGNHYGPDVDGYEYDQWGTYHRADRNGMGIDRTKKGTGFVAQYHEPNSSMYENIETCPEELLLFFHHIPYDYVLKSGVTLIQHIYDTHFEGALEVENMLSSWNELQGRIPEDVYERVSERFNTQLESSKEWRDRINTYFYRKSGIDDNKHRKIYY